MLFWREGGISVERYTNPDCKPEMEELMKDCPRSRSGAECWLRLCDIEDILGDEYDLDRLRELAQADREGRCVVFAPGYPVVSAYYKDEDGIFVRDVTGAVTEEEYEAVLRREKDE